MSLWLSARAFLRLAPTSSSLERSDSILRSLPRAEDQSSKTPIKSTAMRLAAIQPVLELSEPRFALVRSSAKGFLAFTHQHRFYQTGQVQNLSVRFLPLNSSSGKILSLQPPRQLESFDGLFAQGKNTQTNLPPESGDSAGVRRPAPDEAWAKSGLAPQTCWFDRRSKLVESELYTPAGLVILRNMRNATCVI